MNLTCLIRPTGRPTGRPTEQCIVMQGNRQNPCPLFGKLPLAMNPSNLSLVGVLSNSTNVILRDLFLSMTLSNTSIRRSVSLNSLSATLEALVSLLHLKKIRFKFRFKQCQAIDRLKNVMRRRVSETWSQRREAALTIVFAVRNCGTKRSLRSADRRDVPK